MNSRTAVIVALISTSGVLGAAWISSRAPVSVNSDEQPRTVIPRLASPAISVLGVHIGNAQDAMHNKPRTEFSSKDAIVINVAYKADGRVARFPARLTARVTATSIGWGDAAQTVDIAVPGDSFHIFRLSPGPGRTWVPGTHLVSVQVDGAEAYRQLVDVI